MGAELNLTPEARGAMNMVVEAIAHEQWMIEHGASPQQRAELASDVRIAFHFLDLVDPPTRSNVQ